MADDGDKKEDAQNNGSAEVIVRTFLWIKTEVKKKSLNPEIYDKVTNKGAAL